MRYERAFPGDSGKAWEWRYRPTADAVEVGRSVFFDCILSEITVEPWYEHSSLNIEPRCFG